MIIRVCCCLTGGSLIVQDCTWLTFVNVILLNFFVIATALILLLSKTATRVFECHRCAWHRTKIGALCNHYCPPMCSSLRGFLLYDDTSVYLPLLLYFPWPFKNGVKKFTEWSVKQRTRPDMFHCPFLRWPKLLQMPNASMFVVAQCSKF